MSPAICANITLVNKDDDGDSATSCRFSFVKAFQANGKTVAEEARGLLEETGPESLLPAMLSRARKGFGSDIVSFQLVYGNEFRSTFVVGKDGLAQLGDEYKAKAKRAAASATKKKKAAAKDDGDGDDDSQVEDTDRELAVTLLITNHATVKSRTDNIAMARDRLHDILEGAAAAASPERPFVHVDTEDTEGLYTSFIRMEDRERWWQLNVSGSKIMGYSQIDKPAFAKDGAAMKSSLDSVPLNPRELKNDQRRRWLAHLHPDIPDERHVLFPMELNDKGYSIRVECHFCQLLRKYSNYDIPEKKATQGCVQCEMAFHVECFALVHHRRKMDLSAENVDKIDTFLRLFYERTATHVPCTKIKKVKMYKRGQV